jgi:hypothetical protein
MAFGCGYAKGGLAAVVLRFDVDVAVSKKQLHYIAMPGSGR